jgi:Asp-tRNA(Asn)/Glu-tRNA(Gln) amidotransferase A subunit family amidase
MLERLEDWVHADEAARAEALRRVHQRIQRKDPLIRAWVQVRAQPHAADRALSGIPFGVKDVIEAAGLRLEYGSPIYHGRQGAADAAIVRQVRDAGAVLLGKTQTAAFACRTPAPTRNPRNLLHTPGGSSSGSAAAVAAGMVPIAIGTQTHGSVLRPASYCGVTGFKPTYGLLPTEGVLPVARSLDTLGLFTHTPAGMLLLWDALGYACDPRQHDSSLSVGVLDPLPEVEPPMARAFGWVVGFLRSRGVDLQPIAITPRLDRLFQESRVVEQYEGARVHEARFREYGDRLLDIADLVRAGLRMPEARYLEALAFIDESRARMVEQYAATPVILAPAATGPAPRGLTSTGDPRVNSPWTAIGTPAISIPIPVITGLPLGLQLTAAPGQDARVLRAAEWIAGLFESHAGLRRQSR